MPVTIETLGPGQFRGFQNPRLPDQNPRPPNRNPQDFDLAGAGFETHGTDQGLSCKINTLDMSYAIPPASRTCHALMLGLA